MAEKKRIVIIGGVATGPKAAARARRRDPDAQITIIERGKLLSYSGCGMPYCIGGDIEDCAMLNCSPTGVPRDSVFFRNVKDVTVLNSTLAEKINREEKTVDVVNVETGEYQTSPYDKLVIATGGLPVMPPIPGIRLNRIFRLGHPDDAVAMRELLLTGDIKKAVIIGAGLIGMEMIEALGKRGVQVTMVEMLPNVLPKMLDIEIAAFLTKYLRGKGVNIKTNERVTEILGDDHGNVKSVMTANGETLDADMVLVAVGVRPNTKLAQDAGLEIGATRAIAVNEYMQTSDPDIYAGGDCAESINRVTGKKSFWPMGSTANKHGRVIGDNLTGGDSTFPGSLGTAVLKVFDYNVGKTGLSEREAIAEGFDVVSSLMASPDCTHYYPTQKTIFLKLVADAKTGKLLGLQGVGPGQVVKRVDVVATALSFGATAEDLANVDLGYAPPFSSAIDVVAHAANIIRNKIDGLAHYLSPLEVKAKLDADEDFVWLDVRSPDEYEAMRIEDPRVKLIPLGLLRRRLDELPRDKEIVAFCKISLRGYEAQRILEGEGFDNVKFMDGGIVGWPYKVIMNQ